MAHTCLCKSVHSIIKEELNKQTSMDHSKEQTWGRREESPKNHDPWNQLLLEPQRKKSQKQDKDQQPHLHSDLEIKIQEESEGIWNALKDAFPNTHKQIPSLDRITYEYTPVAPWSWSLKQPQKTSYVLSAEDQYLYVTNHTNEVKTAGKPEKYLRKSELGKNRSNRNWTGKVPH